MNKKTIVFIEGTSAMGGVEFSTLYLADKLDRELWFPIVITPEEGDLTRACRVRNIAVEVVERPPLYSTSLQINHARFPNIFSLPFNLWAISRGVSRLSDFLTMNSIDVAVTKGLLTHIYGGIAARKSGIPCIWHLQDFISERYFGLLTKIFGAFAAKLPDHVIVDGRSIARQLPVRLQDKISTILNGIDTSVFNQNIDGNEVRKEFGIPADAMVIGNVARITPWKGQAHLISAFSLISKQIPDGYLLLVGAPVFDTDSYERGLKQQVKKMGIENRVVFAGFRRDLPRVFAAMDVFAYPAVEKDTSPLALLSAMASGLPVIAFSIDGIVEIITDGVEGLLVPPEDDKSMAAAIKKLCHSNSLRLQFGRQARRRAEDSFSLDVFVTNCEKVFLRLTDGQNPNI